MSLWVQVPIPAAWCVIDLRQFLSSKPFSLAPTEKQGKSIDCNFSQFLLFYESPTVLPNFLNNCVIPQALIGQVDNQKRFREYSRVLRCILASRRGLLELEGIQVWCETWALPKLLGESGSWKIFESSINSNRSCNYRSWSRNRLTVRDSWSCCIEYSLHFCWVAPIVLLCSNVFSNLQFLGNFLRSIPGNDGSPSPTRYTNVFSHVELDLSIDSLPIIVVFEIQALVATQSMQILNFFTPNFGSSCSCQKISLSWFFTNDSLLSSSFQVFSEISFIRKGFLCESE